MKVRFQCGGGDVEPERRSFTPAFMNHNPKDAPAKPDNNSGGGAHRVQVPT
jgi:hypothetical protein